MVARLPAPDARQSLSLRIAEDLAEAGWSVCEQFLSSAESDDLAREAEALWRAGAFRQAGVGRGPAWRVMPEVRGDRVLWLDESLLTPAQRCYWQALEGLRQAINARLFLGLFEFEGHLTVYPPGAYYRRHLDQFLGAPDRLVSVILYLNADWQDAQGGALRLHLPQGPRDVLPRAGTLAAFLSDACWHEVLPATRERLSLTGWFRRRA